MGTLDGNVAVVTGAGRGLGRGIALKLAAEGAAVALLGRGAAELEQTAADITAAGGQALALPTDVTQETQVEAALDAVIARHGRLDILVNNAGMALESGFLDTPLEDWNRVIALNLTSVFLVLQRAARRMRQSGGGAVVNIGSIDARGADGPFASYATAKAGVTGLTKVAATELAPFNIRVNTVSPGWCHTKLIEETVPPDALRHLLTQFDRVPMGRMVKIEEVAAAVAFLASPAASAITGADLPVDCGTLANLYVMETLPKT